MILSLLQEDVVAGGVSGWYKLLPELEGQAYNIPCSVEEKIQELEDEMTVCGFSMFFCNDYIIAVNLLCLCVT